MSTVTTILFAKTLRQLILITEIQSSEYINRLQQTQTDQKIISLKHLQIYA
jgi:hypothetical protein